MRILSYMVTRNEASRYLDACLACAREFLDGIAVFDDDSADASVDVAISHGAEVRSRQPGTPSFLEHEGKFRQAAWAWFEKALSPEAGDWVLALDADEFMVGAGPGIIRTIVESEIHRALQLDAWSLRIWMPEVFRVTQEGQFLRQPLIRTDGFWGTIRGTRLFRWKLGGVFADKAMGSGAAPSYVSTSRICDSTELYLMHYGYAMAEDRRLKHERYTALLDHGHSNAHIQSIITSPTLRPFTEALAPNVWRPAWRWQ